MKVEKVPNLCILPPKQGARINVEITLWLNVAHLQAHTHILELPQQHRRALTYSAWTKRLKAWTDLKFFIHFKGLRRAFQVYNACSLCASLWRLIVLLLSATCFWWCLHFSSLHRSALWVFLGSWSSRSVLKELKETTEWARICKCWLIYSFFAFIHISSTHPHQSHVLPLQYSSFKLLLKLKHSLPCKCDWIFHHFITLEFSFQTLRTKAGKQTNQYRDEWDIALAEQMKWMCVVVAKLRGDSEEKNEAPEACDDKERGRKKCESCIWPPSAPPVKGH